MGVLNSELNYDLILNDLAKCCLSEEACGSCSQEECLVGFAKKCITKCFKEGITYVEGGSDAIPVADTKLFIHEQLVASIAHILRQCKSCSYNHFDNCIVNILRNCYEIALFGEVQKYEGSAFYYLNQIHNSHPDLAAEIIEAFHKEENE